MEALALISHLFRHVLMFAALYFCITLFRRRGGFGWLFLGAVFLEPLYLLLWRFVHGRPLLAYKSVSGGEGIMEVNYRVDFPFFYILSVVGLFLLYRQSQKKIGGHDAAA